MAAVLTLSTSILDAQRVQSSIIIIEGESFVGRVTATDGAISAQDMGGFGAGWSSRGQLFWRAPNPVDGSVRNWPRLNLIVNVPVAGDYVLTIRHTQAPDYGDVRVFVRGTAVGDFQGYAAGVRPMRTEVGRVSLTQGANQVMLAVFRRSPGASAAFVGLDTIELAPIRAADPVVAAGSGREGRSGSSGRQADKRSASRTSRRRVRCCRQARSSFATGTRTSTRPRHGSIPAMSSSTFRGRPGPRRSSSGTSAP